MARLPSMLANAQQLDDWSRSGNAHSWQARWCVARQQVPDAVISETPATILQDHVIRWVRKSDNWQPDLSDVASALKLNWRSLQRMLGEQGVRPNHFGTRRCAVRKLQWAKVRI